MGEIEQNPSSAYVVCGEFEHCGTRKLVGYAIEWVKGAFYQRLFLTNFPPNHHQNVKDSLTEITSEHMRKLTRSIDPEAELGEPVEFQSRSTPDSQSK
jgi:hypothetical protein